MTRYPLTWPAGWRRTAPSQRTSARFSTSELHYSTGNPPYRNRKNVTVSAGVTRILTSLRKLGAQMVEGDMIISTNVEVRLDGLPRSNQPAPIDLGAAVYWQTRGTKAEKVMAIDRYDRVADNLAAIAATLEAMRSIDRHGGATILDRAFTGFMALPAPRDWREVLEIGDSHLLTQAKESFYRLSRVRHPDNGGSHAAMAELTAAWMVAQDVLR